jgi:BNR/Asp-box repeat
VMDKLQDDLRAVFGRQQEELGDVQETRRRVMQAALADRDQPVGGRLHFAAGIAAVLLAALVIGTFAYIRAGGGPHLVTPPKASPVPSAGPKTPAAPAGFVILDVAPLDVSAGWVLLSNCVQPITRQCHYSVVHTSDGGRTWSKPVQVGPSSNGSDAGVPRKLTFLNGNDGFEYGSTAAFATHDGGRTWKAVGLQPNWFALIKGRGTMAWVISYPCPKGTVCSYEVRLSVDAGRTWSTPHSLPVGYSPDDGVAIADTGLLLSSEPTGDIELTLDRGTTWSSVAAHCPANTMRSVVTTSDGIELWELCLADVKPGSSKLFVSIDGGKTWSLRTSRPASVKQLPMNFSTILVSTHAGTAVMASDVMMIAITHDDGLTWRTVGPDGILFLSMTFANATDGWALDVNQSLWTTSDGGDHWQ